MNAIPEQKRLVDAVGDEYHRLGLHLVDPQQLLLQCFTRQRIERAERLIHQQNVGLCGERTRQARSLLHTPR